MFFFEKKNQKTLASPDAPRPRTRNKSLFASFSSEKEGSWHFLVPLLLLTLGAGTPIETAIQDPARPAADRARDANRHPDDLLAFAGIYPGEKVADIMPGTGYFTRLFAKAVGAKGHVYAVVPTELVQVAAKLKDAAQSLQKDPAYSNITTVVSPTAVLAVPEKVDLAWTSDNYHDVYGFFGPDQAAAMDRAIFAMLKPGGVFVVIDHVANAGTSAKSPRTLHRIDPATVRQQVEAAGFKAEAESPVLQNPADPHTAIVFDPSVRGHTDQFVFRFRKPG